MNTEKFVVGIRRQLLRNKRNYFACCPNYKPQNKMFRFYKTFCSKITLVNTIQNVILNPI